MSENPERREYGFELSALSTVTIILSPTLAVANSDVGIAILGQVLPNVMLPSHKVVLVCAFTHTAQTKAAIRVNNFFIIFNFLFLILIFIIILF